MSERKELETSSTHQWLIASTVITGGLYAIGYLVDNGYSRLLGTTLDIQEPGQYLIVAGAFVLDVFALLFQSLSEHATLLTVTAFTLLVACVLVVRLKDRPIYKRLMQHCPSLHSAIQGHAFVLLLLASALLEIVIFDVPSIALDATMLRPGLLEQLPLASLPHDDFLRLQSDRLWIELVCSRAEGIGACPLPSAFYDNMLRNNFLSNVLLTMTLLAVSLVAWNGRRHRPHSKTLTPSSTSRIDILGGCLLVLVAIDLLMLPYVYGKTIRSTNFREAKLYIELPEPGQKEKEVRELHAFILSETVHEFSVFEKETLLIWQIPRSQVRLLKVERLRDVLRFSVNSSLTQTEAPIAP